MFKVVGSELESEEKCGSFLWDVGGPLLLSSWPCLSNPHDYLGVCTGTV